MTAPIHGSNGEKLFTGQLGEAGFDLRIEGGPVRGNSGAQEITLTADDLEVLVRRLESGAWQLGGVAPDCADPTCDKTADVRVKPVDFGTTAELEELPSMPVLPLCVDHAIKAIRQLRRPWIW